MTRHDLFLAAVLFTVPVALLAGGLWWLLAGLADALGAATVVIAGFGVSPS